MRGEGVGEQGCCSLPRRGLWGGSLPPSMFLGNTVWYVYTVLHTHIHTQKHTPPSEVSTHDHADMNPTAAGQEKPNQARAWDILFTWRPEAALRRWPRLPGSLSLPSSILPWV